MDVSVVQTQTRVLTASEILQRIGGKRKKLTMELPVAKRKRVIMDLRVSRNGKRKRDQPVGEKKKRLKRELLVICGKRKRLMRERGKKRRLTARELPEEVIIDEILTRLPIKSVIRFKSVSKSWLSLISDSHFLNKHNIRSPMQNLNDYDCFVADKDVNRESCITIVSRSNETFVLPNHSYSLIGSVNGLVCLLRHLKRVSLWNPAIHQSMEFNLPQDKQGGYSCPTLTGVGFDPVSNDYKVVVFYSLLDSCAVYSSNSNSWIQLSVPDHELLMKKCKESFKIFKKSFIPTTYVKDCPYWTYSTYSREDKMIFSFSDYRSNGTYPSVRHNFLKSLTALKFDATSNKFKWLPEFFPDEQSRDHVKTFKFMNMRDLLTLFELTLLGYEPSPIGKIDVYSLDEKEGCGVWIKMHQFAPFQQIRQFQNLQQGFKYGDEIVFFDSNKICYYDHKRKKIKWLPGKEASHLFNCFTYTPNMVSLHGMKSIYTDKQPRPLGHPMRLMNSLKE